MDTTRDIYCRNNTNTRIYFWISWKGSDGQEHWTTNNSGEFEAGQTGHMDLTKASPAIPLGVTVWPTVRALHDFTGANGDTKDGDTKFLYDGQLRNLGRLFVVTGDANGINVKFPAHPSP